MVIVLGGDGTCCGRRTGPGAGTPLLGVNLGHVGFLAEAEREDSTATVEPSSRAATRRGADDDRRDRAPGRRGQHANWALNECRVEKASAGRMLEVVVEIDGRPLSRWGCDGVVCATPTGSTAYAFSAGGPVVWPEVEALLVVPISAHALFARPLVVGPDVAGRRRGARPARRPCLWCDGRRPVDLPPGGRVEVTRGARTRCGSRGCTRTRSPTGWWPSSAPGRGLAREVARTDR